ncbi:methyl-accepting chemotaxis protein [Cellulomonas endometrii]|uniref:methyl-accepting chemotaxis protein n=1 Tax=Cellulomonas endometrii TaxID=3036301 RepID=UPI0024ADF2B6|nr:methyl-accepting chemotaxis protein [Cellulomonas endometrii]
MSTRIVSAVLVSSAVGAFVGILGINALAETNTATTAMYTDNFKGLEYAATIRRATVEMRFNLANHMIAVDEAAKDEAEEKIAVSETEARDAVASYAALPLDATQRASLESFAAALDGYAKVRDTKLLPASHGGDTSTYIAVRDGEGQAFIDAMNESVVALVDGEEAAASEAAATARSRYTSNRTQVLLLLVVGTAVAVGVGIVVARHIVQGLTKVRAVAEAIERGNLTVRSNLESRDEVGRMGQALDAAVADLHEVISTIDASSGALASAAEQMTASSSQIAAASEETAAQAGVVAAAAEQVSRNVQTVAAGSEQMGASIQEIAQNASRAADVADKAVTSVQATTATMSRLGDSSKEIGNVVKLITSIAEQTNLLALNATIEAARAGEAGKGFAVVAGEVKELAQETAKATEDIARRVESIQSDSSGAVDAIDEISRIITQINDFQMTISSAVEEQTSTTGEMNRSVTDAATGSGDIAANIAGVADAAVSTTQGVAETQQAVASLAQMSADLKTLVGRFHV